MKKNKILESESLIFYDNIEVKNFTPHKLGFNRALCEAHIMKIKGFPNEKLTSLLFLTTSEPQINERLFSYS